MLPAELEEDREAGLAVLDLPPRPGGLRPRLEADKRRFRDGMIAAGFESGPGTHPIVPILLGRDDLARNTARRRLEDGFYVIGFPYPVAPKGSARFRVQVWAAHEPEHLDRAAGAFTRVGRHDLAQVFPDCFMPSPESPLDMQKCLVFGELGCLR